MANNEYGLDHHYFKRKMERIVRELDRYTPEEFVTECERMAQTARPLSSSPAGSTLPLPVDDAGSAVVTNKMKAEFIGEFSWKEGWPYYDENGKLHENNVVTHTVPWSLCKEIYKKMVAYAMYRR